MFESYIGIVHFNFHEHRELTSIFTSSFTSVYYITIWPFPFKTNEER